MKNLIERHTELIKKLKSDKFYLEEKSERGENKVSIDMLHAVLGMVDEANEIYYELTNLESYGKFEKYKERKEANIIAEAGDLLWYTNLLVDCVKTIDPGFDVSALLMLNEYREVKADNIFEHVTKIADIVKKSLFYNKSVSTEIVGKHVVGVYNYIVYHVHLIENKNNTSLVSVEQVLTKVITVNENKLKARFGDKFSEEAANNRDLDKEDEAINN